MGRQDEVLGVVLGLDLAQSLAGVGREEVAPGRRNARRSWGSCAPPPTVRAPPAAWRRAAPPRWPGRCPAPRCRSPWRSSASSDAIAPWSEAASASPAPRCRSSTETSGDLEPLPAVRTKASMAAGGRSARSQPSMKAGTGPTGSMCRSPSAVGGSIAKVSISGSWSRSGRSSSRPSASVARQAASTRTNERPRSRSGISESVGHVQEAADRGDGVGAAAAHARHAGRTSAARSWGQNSAPA